VKTRKIAAACLVMLATLFAAATAADSSGTVINFATLDKSHDVHGTLYLPDRGSPPYPAIVMVHGTSGIDQVGAFYRDPLSNAGIAVFEVDFKTGVYHGPMDRPTIATFVPFAFAALQEHRKVPSIDPDRIGYMGFSMGGAIGLRTAVESYRQQWLGSARGFAAFAEFYPITRPFMAVLEKSGSTLTGAPMIVFYGTNDCYGEGRNIPEFKKLLTDRYHFNVTTLEYPGAAHAFNRNAPTLDYRDPAAIDQKGHMEWNADAANDSLTRVVDFVARGAVAQRLDRRELRQAQVVAVWVGKPCAPVTVPRVGPLTAEMRSFVPFVSNTAASSSSPMSVNSCTPRTIVPNVEPFADSVGAWRSTQLSTASKST
jgi:uncharacterized protein